MRAKQAVQTLQDARIYGVQALAFGGIAIYETPYLRRGEVVKGMGLAGEPVIFVENFHSFKVRMELHQWIKEQFAFAYLRLGLVDLR